MKTAPVVAPRLELDAEGTPYSPQFGDVYHPRAGALEQARSVFLAGNGLPARWRDRERFVVLESGFGLGNNFLATWSAWRDDPARSRRLHFISIEGHPLAKDALARLPRDAGLVPLADELVAAWPPSAWSMHRLSFENGRVELLLAFGDIASWLPQIEARVDAFFLDGFAPARNPRMWEPRLFKAMARIAAPDASAATWSAARIVRDGLRDAGFQVERADGTGAKRVITVARFAPRVAPKLSPRRAAASLPDGGEPVAIVGAGLAGCAAAWALAEHGVASLLLERRNAIASEGSGNTAGLFHGVVHRDDARHSRFHRAAALEAMRQVEVAIARHGVAGRVDGLLRLETSAAGLDDMRATLARLGFPPDYARAVSAGEASALAGVAIGVPAWHFRGGGWVDPRGLARSFLERAKGLAEVRLGADVASLRHVDGRWEVRDSDGRTLAMARTVVLAEASGGSALLGGTAWPIERRRGQLSAVDLRRWPAQSLPRIPIAGSGYVLPAVGDAVWFGATTQATDGDPTVRDDDHRSNLERLHGLVLHPPSLAVGDLFGRTSFRWSSIDRLPLVGPVPLAALDASLLGPGRRGNASSARPEQARFAARAPGLFMMAALGSRGIAAASIGARVLASAITGAPAPLEADLLDAIDPARFATRAFRHRGALPNQWVVGPMAGGSADA